MRALAYESLRKGKTAKTRVYLMGKSVLVCKRVSGTACAIDKSKTPRDAMFTRWLSHLLLNNSPYHCL